MLRLFLFELFRVITIQHCFVYTVQMQKKKKKKETRKNMNTVLQKNRYHLLK